MKNLFFTLLIASSFSIDALSQFSESFFERLGPTPTSFLQSDPYIRNNFYGIAIQHGALAVRFADSLDTEVQWVKTDLNGNYQFFSANLPTSNISQYERIIQLFEVGNKQYIVTNDSLSYAPKGIRIHKYENYTQNAGYFEFPTSFRWKCNQVYFQYGKIYIFFVNASQELKRLIVDPVTMTLENELILTDYNFSESGSNISKSIHVQFFNATDMDVYLNADTKLARVKIINNIPNSLELREMNLKKVLGIDFTNNKIICLKRFSGYDLQWYQLNPNLALDELQILDSLNLPGNVVSSVKDWAYATNGVTEFFHSMQDARYFTKSSNQVVILDSVNFGRIYTTNIDLINGKPITFGVRQSNFISEDGNFRPLLFISHGEANQLYKFKEYTGVHSFGFFNTRFGTGNALIPNINSFSSGDYIFSNMIYNLSQVFAGKANGQLKGFYRGPYGQQYKPGPYTQPSQYNQEVSDRYNENLYVDLYMVNQHVASMGNQNYTVPKSIANWPAHGNVSKGQPANLAPFMDLNNNGTYDPFLGEYPVFPGSRCLLNISHQHESDFNNEGSGLELHTYMYKFDCGDSIENVIFIKTDVFNRGNIDYDSLSAGLIADFDLGGPFDDYIGTHVENGLIYAYNGRDYDEPYNQWIPGYKDSIPTIGILFLRGSKFPANSMDDSKGIGPNQTVNGMGFNDGIVDNEYKGLEYSAHFSGNGSAEPHLDGLNAIEWNNYLNGKWKFGDSMVYGSNGYPDAYSTHIPSRYTFPGDTDPLFYGTYGTDPGFYWSEAYKSATFLHSNAPGDRRMVGSFGSGALLSGDKITYHSAILSGKRIPGAGQSQIDLFAKAKHIRTAFDQNLTSCGQTFGNTTQEWVTSVPETAKELEITVYPNPFADELFVAVSLLDENTTLQLFDINGKIILSEKVTSGKHVIKTNSVENGIYFLRIENGNGSTTKKVVKQ